MVFENYSSGIFLGGYILNSFILWLEGVDFDAHLLDTQELSVQRGASLALLRASRFAEKFLQDKLGEKNVEAFVLGASQGGFKINVDETRADEVVRDLLQELQDSGADPDDIKKNAKEGGDWPDVAPYAHLSFVCGLAAIGENDNGATNAIRLARSKAKAKQFRRFTLRPIGEPAGKSCKEDKFRPANTSIYMPEDEKGEKSLVSRSVAARRHYGRYARQAFYKHEIGTVLKQERVGDERQINNLEGFVDSFEEMVKDPPAGQDGELPLSLRSKIAVFYADGNDFGKKRGSTIEEQRIFDQTLRKRQGQEMLKPIIEGLDRLRRKGNEQRWQYAATCKTIRGEGPYLRLRFETLLWGGDEVMFVVPSWLGWWLAARFFQCVNKRQNGQDLTFAAGLVFCNHKTPIRAAQKMARDLSDEAKNFAKRFNPPINAISAEALESVEPPEAGFPTERIRMLGLRDEDEAKNGLILPGSNLDEILGRALKLSKKFPRAQLYRLLRRAATEKKFGEADDGEIAVMLNKYLKGAGADLGLELEDLLLLTVKDHELSKRLPLNLYWLAQNWDYLVPEMLAECGIQQEGGS